MNSPYAARAAKEVNFRRTGDFPMTFKNDKGHWLLNALFFEMTLADKTGVVYTLKDQDHEGFPSLYRLYMEADDPTEYTFAVKHLGGWEHWKRLCECSWFKPYVEKWREELEVRLRAGAIARIRAESVSDGRNAFSATKYLADGEWLPKDAKKRSVGRPSKAAIKEEANRLFEAKNDISEDFDRILRSN